MTTLPSPIYAGSHPPTVIAQLERAIAALDAARAALQETCPNGRDYAGQEILTADREHMDRLRSVGRVADQLREILSVWQDYAAV